MSNDRSEVVWGLRTTALPCFTFLVRFISRNRRWSWVLYQGDHMWGSKRPKFKAPQGHMKPLRLHSISDFHTHPIWIFRPQMAGCLSSASPGKQTQGIPKKEGNFLYGELHRLPKTSKVSQVSALRHCEASVAFRRASPVTVSCFNCLDPLQIVITEPKILGIAIMHSGC